MCLLTLLVIIAVIALILFHSLVVSIIFTIIFLFTTIGCAMRYSQAKRLEKSKKKCPKCNSTKIQFQFIATGASATTYHYRTVPFSQSNSSVNQEKRALCEDCGYSFPFFAEDDISKELSESSRALAISAFLLTCSALFLIVIIAFLHSSG